MSERILVRKIEHNLWQWREASAEGAWLRDAFYTGDINLLKESVEGRQVWLIVPGQEVVSQRVDVEIKDRKQLLKILPYEIEDSIIDAVEDLHFVYGVIENDTIPVAYANAEWLQSCITEVEATGAEVQRCSVDYLQLPRPVDGWILLLENDVLMAQVDSGVGFAVEQPMAGAFLAALATQQLAPASLHLYGDSEASLMALHALLPAELTQNEAVVITEQEAGFWDLVSAERLLAPEFRNGKLARRLPFDKWWHEFKYPIIAAAAESGESVEVLAERMTARFAAGYAALGVLAPDLEPKATEHVPEIIRTIETLIDRGLAYQSHGDVYFSVRAFDGYGKLSGRNLDDLRAGGEIKGEQAERHASPPRAAWHRSFRLFSPQGPHRVQRRAGGDGGALDQ